MRRQFPVINWANVVFVSVNLKEKRPTFAHSTFSASIFGAAGERGPWWRPVPRITRAGRTAKRVYSVTTEAKALLFDECVSLGSGTAAV